MSLIFRSFIKELYLTTLEFTCFNFTFSLLLQPIKNETFFSSSECLLFLQLVRRKKQSKCGDLWFSLDRRHLSAVNELTESYLSAQSVYSKL